LGEHLDVVFAAPSTTDRDRKELLATLLSEVIITIDRAASRADLMLRWKGGAITDLTVPIIARQQKRLRTDEDTVDLVRRLAVYYPDAQIAGILNRQQTFHRHRVALHRRPSARPAAPLEHRLPPRRPRRRERRTTNDHRRRCRRTATAGPDAAPVDHRRLP